MVDLKLNYTQPGGVHVTENYDTIMDFTDVVEDGTYPRHRLHFGPVDVTFFENPLLDKQFPTVQDLYNHCVNIMKGHT